MHATLPCRLFGHLSDCLLGGGSETLLLQEATLEAFEPVVWDCGGVRRQRQRDRIDPHQNT
eukprot:CAMPEP_0206557098 /NCGR_PEP_ID=MMETSP0325_2-20121206/18872_1 /ASSEMBLY_ACC=CAM_ASM_000347 /TAXON_ID=2866 /ORGANISM="Crypthecodinium cohnii, Strain Seligo" /LENGTH=60 /DNA_ID=CAMNT_0054057895 /DNA_START=172 /DNA_END=351 /DNA_ORIENTATION=+